MRLPTESSVAIWKRSVEAQATPPRRAGWRARATLAAAGLAAAVLIGEGGLRAIGPRLPAVYSLATIATFQTYHPIYGFFHRPGATGWIVTPEFTSYVRINSRGLRDRDLEVPKPPGTYRVLMLGDSLVEGAQVPLENTVAKRLEVELQATNGSKIEVVNAGNAGFGTGQELLFLEHDGPTYEPDLVVLVFFVDNDLADNGFAVSRERKLDTTRRPFFVPDGRGGLELRPFSAPPPDPFGGLRSGLRQVSLLYNVAENLVLTREARDHENQQIGKNRPTYQVESPPEWQEAWQVTELLIARMRDTAREMGIQLVLVVAPSSSQVSEQAWRVLVSGDSQARAARYDPEAPNRRLAVIAERTGVKLLDLLPPIRAAAAEGARPYFPDDGHWTNQGHAVGAREITAYLGSGGLIPAR